MNDDLGQDDEHRFSCKSLGAGIKAFVFLTLLLPALLAQSENRSQGQSSGTSHRSGYVGDAACGVCHAAELASYRHTAHHLTSQLASRRSVLGSFAPGSNRLVIIPDSTNQPGLLFKMEVRSGGLYETAITGSQPPLELQSARIDVVTGSGKRGQTYLSWDGDQLFELPVSYWTNGKQWINSPGYEDGTADFGRPVNPGCLECHATYIKTLSNDPHTNEYEKSTLETGISCEVCHGPGAGHAARQPRSGTTPLSGAPKILNPARFSRERQVDLCAFCHNGIKWSRAVAFSYRPGESLSDFFEPTASDVVEHPDVHGHQVGLLERSKCFRSSQMTCSTCHNVHSVERSAAGYSEKCLGCHAWQSCGASKKLGPQIGGNCIDCHMPVEPTTMIASVTAGRKVRGSMRNHWISVYPETMKR